MFCLRRKTPPANGENATTTEGPLPTTRPACGQGDHFGRSPDLRIIAWPGLPTALSRRSDIFRLHSPPTVAGAVTELASKDDTAPCSLLSKRRTVRTEATRLVAQDDATGKHELRFPFGLPKAMLIRHRQNDGISNAPKGVPKTCAFNGEGRGHRGGGRQVADKILLRRVSRCLRTLCWHPGQKP